MVPLLIRRAAALMGPFTIPTGSALGIDHVVPLVLVELKGIR